jgi:hypothetical protein
MDKTYISSSRPSICTLSVTFVRPSKKSPKTHYCSKSAKIILPSTLCKTDFNIVHPAVYINTKLSSIQSNTDVFDRILLNFVLRKTV